MTAPLLQVAELRVNYRRLEAVHAVGLEVRRGEVVALFGNNGAGKTSTIDAIMGVTSGKVAGRILWRGEPIDGMPSHKRRRLGIVEVPEGRHVFPRMTVDENLEVALLSSDTAKSAFEERLEEMYQTFPALAERRDQVAGSLSGGEAQMLAVGRGLIGHPDLLMIDEPSLGLAPIVTQAILTRLRDLAEARGLAVLISEQKLMPTLDVCDRAGVLDRGSLTYWGSASELSADPLSLRRTYLGGAPTTTTKRGVP